MRFTDVFIKKPILASVVSLFIILLGLRAIMDMNVRQFPEIQNAVISVSTTYVGADADLIQGFITTPLEREIAAAEGIDYLVSTSVAGNSTIEAYLRLDYDPNQALTQIAAQVNKVRSELPENAREPVVTLKVGESVAAMYLAFYSEVLGDNQITDYLVRVVEPQLSTIPGVQRAEILGARTFAMRVWLDSVKMAAYGLTGSDVATALRSNNVLAALGRTKGQMVAIDLTAATDLRDVEEFKQLVVSSDGQSVVRLADVAEVELGAENYESSVSFNGLAATFIGIEVSPDANALDVIADVRQVWDQDIIPQLPQGL
ncbi:MAG: efflux RND transporter permease subunit, partial [Vibrio metschnikovii]